MSRGEWLSIREACQRLDRSRSRILQLLRSGELEGELVTFGGLRVWRVRAASVAAWRPKKPGRRTPQKGKL